MSYLRKNNFGRLIWYVRYHADSYYIAELLKVKKCSLWIPHVDIILAGALLAP